MDEAVQCLKDQCQRAAGEGVEWCEEHDPVVMGFQKLAKQKKKVRDAD